MSSAFMLVSVSIALASCVSDAQFALQSPIMERCAAAGLSNCRNLAQATLLYAEGNPVDGRRKLLAGLQENRGKSGAVERFALGLEQVSAISSGGEFQAPLQPVVYLLRQVADQQEQKPTTQDNRSALRTSPSVFGGRIESQLVATSVELPNRAVAATRPATISDETTPLSVFFMLAGNALAGDCRFPGAPMMRCVHEAVETTRIVSDIMVSPACPYDVLFASRHGIELDWATYAPAGKGAEVHGAELPLIPGRTLTAGVGYTTNDATPDVRCGITVVWRDAAESTADPRRPIRANELTFVPRR